VEDVDYSQRNAAATLGDPADEIMSVLRQHPKFGSHPFWGDPVAVKRLWDEVANAFSGRNDTPMEDDVEVSRIRQARAPRPLYANMHNEDDAFWSNQAELQKYARKRL
jgi:hypothetical protein